MVDMLTRPLTDNRMLRASGAADLATTLGQSAGAVFETPMMTGLTLQQMELERERAFGFTEEQFQQYWTDEFNRHQEVQSLEAEFGWATDERRDEVSGRLQTLNEESAIQLQAETQRSIDEGRLQEPEALNELYG